MAVEIIGRREELLAFDGFLRAVPAGGQALLLEGDAGIGKTALWQEGNRLARERGCQVLASRSAHSETQIAFASLGDVFGPVVEEMLPQLTPVQRRALETALLMREPDGPPPEVRLLGLALLSVVRALAQDGPLLVVWVRYCGSALVGPVLIRRVGRPSRRPGGAGLCSGRSATSYFRAFSNSLRCAFDPTSSRSWRSWCSATNSRCFVVKPIGLN